MNDAGSHCRELAAQQRDIDYLMTTVQTLKERIADLEEELKRVDQTCDQRDWERAA